MGVAKEKIEEMLIFTKNLCRANNVNQFHAAERNNFIIGKIAEEFSISREDADFVFDNNNDIYKVYNHFN